MYTLFLPLGSLDINCSDGGETIRRCSFASNRLHPVAKKKFELFVSIRETAECKPLRGVSLAPLLFDISWRRAVSAWFRRKMRPSARATLRHTEGRDDDVNQTLPRLILVVG